MKMLKKLSFIILLIWFSACMNENESNTDTIKTNKSETPSEEEAKYELTFNALWSSATHPVDFPPAPTFRDLSA
ncbi:MAG: hypothetical protein P8O98_01770 [Flavobacteriaceae bacterium]|nr:hypothetical protein [Flavobacteriaceae bacterium]